ncbi:MAG: efflux RND transporter periplasmic adaptor subunit, partial [Kiritimatiellae bacterium]|nr:efflux RND transporter periplasmic adaptor subunit [Kiritimatiellia bacterium]
ESNFHQAEMAMERAMRKAKADIVQVEAELKAKDAEFVRQKTKLAKLNAQLSKAKIYAPVDGMVIYATSARAGGSFRGGSQQPLEEGQEVFERQELIYLPTTDSTMAEVAIHESSLEKVHVGLPAIITIDALPGKKFLGRLAVIAPLPDARSIWMNPNLNVYNSKIYLDETNPELRTGMSCKTEIIIEQHDDAVSVPVQAVMRVKGEPTVYVMQDQQITPRKVEIGLDNNRMIRIISGLKEGEVVMLTPPLKSGTIESLSENRRASSTLENTSAMKQRINERIQKANGSKQGGKNLPAIGQTDQLQKNNRPAEVPAGKERYPIQQQVRGKDSSDTSSQNIEKMKQNIQTMSTDERGKMRQQQSQNANTADYGKNSKKPGKK